jgi:hypothetical protein
MMECISWIYLHEKPSFHVELHTEHDDSDDAHDVHHHVWISPILMVFHIKSWWWTSPQIVMFNSVIYVVDNTHIITFSWKNHHHDVHDDVLDEENEDHMLHHALHGEHTGIYILN